MQVRSLIGVVAAALIVTTVPGPGTAAAPPDPVQVRPDALSKGAAPTVAYVNSAGNLVRPGRTTVDYPRPISHPLRAHHGYVVQVTRRDQGFLVDDIYFVPDTGARRLLWRNSLATQAAERRYMTPVLASTNGRLVVLDTYGGYLVVKRVSDGRTVASYRVPKGRSIPRPLAFRGNNVLLADGPESTDGSVERDRFSGYLARWDVKKHRVTRVLSNARAKASGFDAVAALDLSAGQAALATGKRQLVRPLPGRSGPHWRTGRNELVESWSPDDRFVLSIVAEPGFDVSDHDLPAFATIRIRRARTGALVAEFRGLLAVRYPAPQSPVWESDSRSILMSAFMGINDDRDEDLYGTGHGYVRCRVVKRSCALVLPRYAGARLPADLVDPFAGVRAR